MKAAAINETSSAHDARTWEPLRLLTFYRVILAGLLTILFFGLPGQTTFGVLHPQVYAVTSMAYLVLSVIAGFCTRLRIPGYEVQAITQVLVDIIAITILMFASAGPASGLGILLVIAVATGSILLGRHIAHTFAAFATLAVMGEYFYSDWLTDGGRISGFTHAGLLGMTFFATVAVTSLLVRRIRESEALARRSAIDAADLANLNAHIVQRLMAGIIVTDHDDNVRLINDTAKKLLHASDSGDGEPLATLSGPLDEKLQEWRREPGKEPTLLFLGSETDSVLPHFTQLDTAGGKGALIFLEDTAAIIRQTQQIKLASLGRLTASIAHEIRNPLGAISHATQLLNEDDSLRGDNRRLMSIIDDNAGKVNAIVQNILQLSRPVHSVPQTVQLEAWLEKFIDEFTSSGNCRPGQISARVDPTDIEIRMDPSLLHQVVWNLCQNSMQHADGSDDVGLRLVAGYLGTDGTAYLDIIDNGPGIPAGMMDRIFEPFFTTHTSGTGLGLFIARDICESNNTTLEYLPQPDGGSCFRLTFIESLQLPVTALA